MVSADANVPACAGIEIIHNVLGLGQKRRKK
jgi:hypothetical protein